MTHEDFPAMAIGACAAVILLCIISMIGTAGSWMAKQSIIEQCNGKYHEFTIFDKTFTCTEQK